MSLKGQVKYSCATGRFEKWVKAELSNVSYYRIKHFSGGIFLKPMLMYDQGVVKIQKMGKQIFCFNHVYGSLNIAHEYLSKQLHHLCLCAVGLADLSITYFMEKLHSKITTTCNTIPYYTVTARYLHRSNSAGPLKDLYCYHVVATQLCCWSTCVGMRGYSKVPVELLQRNSTVTSAQVQVQ